MKRTLLLVICIVVLLISVALVSGGGGDWTIEGDSVYVNDSRVYASITPHTIGDFSEDIIVNFTSKVYSGDVYVVFGFDTTEAKPEKSYRWNPRNITWNESHSYFFFNVSKINLTTSSCTIGDEDSLFRRNVTYINEYHNFTATDIACFDSYIQEGNNYTIYWNTSHWYIRNWTDFTDNWDSIDYEYGGMDKWYYKDVPIVANKSYKLKVDMKVTPTLGEFKGKYWFAFYPEKNCTGAGNCLERAINMSQLYYIDPWWNTTFDKCRNITITNAANEVLVNFPVYINLTHDSDMQPDFIDIRYVNETCDNGGSELDYEIENYTDSVLANTWVRIPSIPVEGINISVYYNNQSGVDDGQNPTAVWNDNYMAVYHMNDSDPVTTVKDSTQFANLGIKAGVDQPNESIGRIAEGQYFNQSTGDDISAVHSDSLNINGTNITMESWFYLENTPSGRNFTTRVIMNKYRRSFGGYALHTYYHRGPTVSLVAAIFTNASYEAVCSVTGVAIETWQHAVFTYSSPVGTMYLNGINMTSCTIDGGEIDSDPQSFDIGEPSGGSSNWRHWNGTLDEIRLSNTSRSAGWVLMTFENMNNHDGVINISDEQNITVPVTDNDNDTFNSTIDCDDDNATVRPLHNESTHWLNSSIVVCGGVYNNTHVIVNNSSIFMDCNGSVLDGFNKGGFGIDLDTREGIDVYGCTLRNYSDGIEVVRTNHSNISNNTLYDNDDEGIRLSSSSTNNTVINNTAYNNAYGILISGSRNNTVINNTAYNNTYDGIVLVTNAHNNNVSDNVVYTNIETGISLFSSNNNTITNNTVYNNSLYGISIGGSPSLSNNITNNSIYNNSWSGIFISSTTRNTTVTNNIIANNTLAGINISGSANHTVYNNYFNNTQNAWSDSTGISWNVSKYISTGNNILGNNWIAGNFWDDYNGSDTDGDGIGDTELPYHVGISTGGDYAPLVLITDTAPPNITIEPPSDYNVSLNRSWFLINISLNESGGGANIEINGTNYSLSQGLNNTLWNSNITLSDGNWTWKVYAWDLAGNVAVTGESWIYITSHYVSMDSRYLLVEIYMTFSLIAISLFVFGALMLERFNKGIFLLALALMFFTVVAFYSFAIVKFGAGDNIVLSETFNFFTLGVFYSFMILLTIALIIFYTLYAGVKVVGETDMGQ